MLKKILIALLCIAAVFVIVVTLQPGTFEVSRSASMAASADAVFANVNDLHNWPAWSPWAKLDPNMKQTYEGAPAGVGASTYWIGNKDVGEGRMTIMESRP